MSNQPQPEQRSLPSYRLQHDHACAVHYCGWEWSTDNRAGVCRQTKDAEIHYVGTPDSHEYVDRSCSCGLDQTLAALDAVLARLQQLEEENALTEAQLANMQELFAALGRDNDVANDQLAKFMGSFNRERERAEAALQIARKVTNTWACVARAKRDFDAIYNFHQEINALEAAE